MHAGLPTVADIFGVDPPDDVEERVVLVHHAIFDHIAARELTFRLFLRNALLQSAQAEHTGVPQRPGYRLAALDVALEPLARRVDRRSWSSCGPPSPCSSEPRP